MWFFFVPRVCVCVCVRDREKERKNVRDGGGEKEYWWMRTAREFRQF